MIYPHVKELEKDVIARLICEKVKITLKFDTSEYPELDPIESITDDNGKTITLPEISDTFIDSDGIKWHAKEWIINGSHYNQGASYVLPYNSNYEITATVVCEKANVTLKFAKTDYQFLDIPGFPSSRTEHSGTTITLPTLSGNYDYDDHTYTPTAWSIGAFGSSYVLKQDITADLICTESVIEEGSIDFITDDVTLNEGQSITRSFRLGAAPHENVTVHITDTSRIASSRSDLTFTPGNWNTNQAVTFTATLNQVAEGQQTSDITITSSSSDSRYNGLSYSLHFVINDVDTAGIVYDSTSGSVIENSQIVRKIKLNSKPRYNVTVSFSSSNSRLNVVTNSVSFDTLFLSFLHFSSCASIQ